MLDIHLDSDGGGFPFPAYRRGLREALLLGTRNGKDAHNTPEETRPLFSPCVQFPTFPLRWRGGAPVGSRSHGWRGRAGRRLLAPSGEERGARLGPLAHAEQTVARAHGQNAAVGGDAHRRDGARVLGHVGHLSRAGSQAAGGAVDSRRGGGHRAGSQAAGDAIDSRQSGGHRAGSQAAGGAVDSRRGGGNRAGSQAAGGA
eukprot:1193680-Prorocentrum_minimum.AAC.1